MPDPSQMATEYHALQKKQEKEIKKMSNIQARLLKYCKIYTSFGKFICAITH